MKRGWPAMTLLSRLVRVSSLLCAWACAGCMRFGAVDVAPDYEETKFVVPDSWNGAGPFVQANPGDAVLRRSWWKLFGDPLLNTLETQATKNNPDLHAAAERFVQARHEMMKARSQFLPQIGIGVGASQNKQSTHALFRADTSPLHDSTVSLGGGVSWEPDFWSKLRNATRAQIYRAQELAANYASARLSIQAELAANYFVLRGLDAREAIYLQSIEYYEKSLDIVTAQFRGALASGLDTARAEYLLARTKAQLLGVQGKRQVVEHAIAILVNRAPAAFSIPPVEQLDVATFQIPLQVPSTMLERRPDVAAMEREMAQANRLVGIARAAFFPSIGLHVGAGFEGLRRLFDLDNGFWSYGADVNIPLFQGGYLRAQLHQSWSVYRETQDRYRSTVLNAFREVQDGLSLTHKLAEQVAQQETAVAAATKTQDLSMELFKSGLASSLELINAQVNTLDARITSAELKAELLRSVVDLIRALGGGWHRNDLPKDDEIPSFKLFRRAGDKPPPAGGIDVEVEHRDRARDLTQPLPR